MSTAIPENYRDLLSAEVATLSTIGPDGRPQSSEVWFLAEGDTVSISLNSSRQKMKNLLANPAVSLFILDLGMPYRYLELRGDASEAAELLGQADCIVDGLDDDPFLPGAAERLPLDELALQPVTGQAVAVAGDAPAAVAQFHQLALAHAGQGGSEQEACGVGVAGEVADVALVQRQGPWRGPRVVGAGHVRGAAAPWLGGADDRDGLLDQRPGRGERSPAEPAGSRLAGQRGEADVQERVLGAPSPVQAGAGGGTRDRLQWLALVGVAAQRLLDPAEVRGGLPELGVLLLALAYLRWDSHQVRGDSWPAR